MKLGRILATALAIFQLSALGSLASAGEKTATEVDYASPFEISPTGHQVVTLQYNGKRIRMILDTAAGANVFSRKAAKKPEPTLKGSELQAAGLGVQAHAMT